MTNTNLDAEMATARLAAKKWLSDNVKGRKATINDVAKLANVSKKTISRIINKSPSVAEKTRARVQVIIDTLNYEPDPQARGLAFRHSFLVGLIYDNPNPQYVVNIQQGILDVLKDTQYELLVHPCSRSDPNFLTDARQFIERQRLFGVILTSSVSEDPRLAEVLRDLDCRYVRVSSVSLDKPDHMVVTNDRDGASLAAEHLCELGHKKIAFVTGRLDFLSSQQRQQGFEAGLRKHGQSLRPEYIVQGDYTFLSGRAAGEALLAYEDPPTAVFCANDEMAAGCLLALRLAGFKAPERMSIVGFDDYQIASTVWPRLTTVRSPTRDIGRHAAAHLLAENDIKVDLLSIVPELIIRESSGLPPK